MRVSARRFVKSVLPNVTSIRLSIVKNVQRNLQGTQHKKNCH